MFLKLNLILIIHYCFICISNWLAFYKMNLTKIQSLPIVGVEWEYQFYIDLMFDEYSRYKLALGAIVPLTKELEILGEYQNGQRPSENKIG